MNHFLFFLIIPMVSVCCATDSCEEAKFAMFDAVLLSGMVKVIGEAKEVRTLLTLIHTSHASVVCN